VAGVDIRETEAMLSDRKRYDRRSAAVATQHHALSRSTSNELTAEATAA
jgi:hypothetical protein